MSNASNGTRKWHCAECGDEFKPIRPWQEYCSYQCGNKARWKRRYKKVKAAIRLMDRKRKGGGSGA